MLHSNVLKVPPPEPSLMDPTVLQALSEALLQRLLPELKSIVEDAVIKATTVSSPASSAGTNSNTTQLGNMQPGRMVTVDWTLAGGDEPWPPGTRLRFLGGSMQPPAGYQGIVNPTGSSGQLTVQAALVAPTAPGAYEAQWQLEDGDGLPLVPPLRVQGMVPTPTPSTGASCGSASNAAIINSNGGVAGGRVPPTQPVQQPNMRAVAFATVPGAAASLSAQLQSSPGRVGGLQPMAQPIRSSIDQDWAQAFEGFFGRENAARLRTPDNTKVRDQMVNLMWEHLKDKGQTRAEVIHFDEATLRVFAPALPNGSRTLALKDLLPVIHTLLTRYVQLGV